MVTQTVERPYLAPLFTAPASRSGRNDMVDGRDHLTSYTGAPDFRITQDERTEYSLPTIIRTAP